MSPAPDQEGADHAALGDRVAGVGGAQSVGPGVGAAELQPEREGERGDQVGELDPGEVVAELGDRVAEAVDLPIEVDAAEWHAARLSCTALEPAGSRSTVLASTLLAAALAAVYLAWAPAEPGPGGGDVPRRPVLRPRLRALEQRLVFGPLPALLQRPLPAARRPARPRASPARSSVVAAAALFAALARRRYGAAALVPALWFAAAVAAVAAHRADPVPARAPVRPRSAARRRLRSPARRRRAGGAREPREPGRRPVRRPRRRRARDLG